MRHDHDPDVPPGDIDAHVEAAAGRLGALIRTERRLRELTLARLAEAADVSITSVHGVEAGRQASLDMYVRLAHALDRRLVIDLAEPAMPEARPTEDAGRAPHADVLPRPGRDIVHATMGELEASRFLALGRDPGIDVPWQHFRFGGRADIIVCDLERRALLHIENKGQLPDVQDAFGRFNEKQAYLGQTLWERLGMAGPPLVETHVMVALWSAEVIEVVRQHQATFRATFRSPPDAFLAWWSGKIPARGSTSAFVLFDPFATGRVPSFAGLREVLSGVPPRVVGYAAAADLIRRGRTQGR